MSSDDTDERQGLLFASHIDHGTIPSRQQAEQPSTQSIKPWNDDLTTAQLVLMLVGSFVGAFLAAVDSTLVGTLGGAISSSLGDLRLLSWLGSSYFIATCVSQPIVGKITDIYGRKPVLVISNLIFCLGNLLCALTQTEGGLIAGRVIAGLGGGAVQPIVAFIMSDVIPLRRRGVWQGAVNICFGLGSGIGGPLGGWSVEIVDWRWAFALQVPITVIAVVLILFLQPETAPGIRVKMTSGSSREDAHAGSGLGEDESETNLAKLRRVNLLGTLSLVAFLILLLLGLNSGGTTLPWSSPLVITSLCASAVFLGLFILVERNVATEPILKLGLFANRTLTASWLANWFASMARFGLLFYGPLLFQAQGYSVRDTGLRFVPESAAIVVASMTAGWIMRVTGKHYWLGIGVVSLQILGLLLVCLFTAEPLAGASVPAWTAFIFLFLQGAGYSGMLTTTLIAMIAAVEQKWQAVVTSTSYAFRSTGSVIGITIASVVFQNSLRLMILGSRIEESENVDRHQLLDRLQHDLHYMDSLHEPVQSQVREVYIYAVRTPLLALSGLAVLALLSAAFIKQHKLHTSVSRRD